MKLFKNSNYKYLLLILIILFIIYLIWNISKDKEEFVDQKPCSRKELCNGATIIMALGTGTRNENIYPGVFNNYTELAAVTISNTVKSIGSEAFKDCTSLKSIEIPNSVTSIRGRAFEGCTSLESIETPNSVTSIGEFAFYSCKELDAVTISNSAKSIGDSAFGYCSELNSIIIPDSVKSIGDSAFSYCTQLVTITIPNSVTSIGEDAFYYCTQLETVTIGNSVTSMGEGGFTNCSSLTTVTINYNPTYPLTKWPRSVFTGTSINKAIIKNNTQIPCNNKNDIENYFKNYNQDVVVVYETTPTTTSPIPTDNFNKLYYYNVINKSIPHENINFFEFNNTNSKIFANLKGTNTVGFYFKLPETTANSYKIISSNRYNENNNLDTFTNPIWSLNFIEGNFYIKYKQNKIQQKYKFNIIIDNTEIIYIKIAYNLNLKILSCNINSDQKIIENIKYYKHILLFGNNSSKLNNNSSKLNNNSTDTKPNNMLVGDIKIENIYDPDLEDKILICKYNPSKDKTKYNCVHKCLKLNNCNQPKCDKICKYIAGSDFSEEKLNTDKEPDPPSNIRVIPQDNGFIIEFIKPEYEGYNAKITKYIVVVKNKFTKLKNINDEKIYSFNSNNDSELKYSIKGLDNNKMYNIFVLSYNDKNLISKTASEIETSSPDGTSEEIHDLLIEPDSVISKQINDYIGEHLDEKDDYCKAEDKFNFNLINLDKIDRNEYQNKIKQIVLDNERESEISNSIKNTIENNPILKNSDEEDISINEIIQDSNSVSILKDFENYN